MASGFGGVQALDDADGYHACDGRGGDADANGYHDL